MTPSTWRRTARQPHGAAAAAALRQKAPASRRNQQSNALHLYLQGTAACARQYMAAHRLAGVEPLPLLCLGVAQLTAALSKKVPDRDRAVLTAFALLQARPPPTSRPSWRDTPLLFKGEALQVLQAWFCRPAAPAAACCTAAAP